MFKISKKIALTMLLCGAFIANVSADSFLSNLIEKHPYITALGCVVMGYMSYQVGIAFNHQIDHKIQHQFNQAKKNAERLNIQQLHFTFRNMTFDKKKYWDPITAPEKANDYYKTLKFDDQKSIFLKKIEVENKELSEFINMKKFDVRYKELPPPRYIKDEKEIVEIPTMFYEPEINKNINRKIPYFCLGVSALNFATAVGLAAYRYTRKA